MAYKTCWTVLGSILPMLSIQTIFLFLTRNSLLHGLLVDDWEINDLRSTINVQIFSDFAVNLRAQNPNKAQTKLVNIMGVYYYARIIRWCQLCLLSFIISLHLTSSLFAPTSLLASTSASATAVVPPPHPSIPVRHKKEVRPRFPLPPNRRQGPFSATETDPLSTELPIDTSYVVTPDFPRPLPPPTKAYLLHKSPTLLRGGSRSAAPTPDLCPTMPSSRPGPSNTPRADHTVIPASSRCGPSSTAPARYPSLSPTTSSRGPGDMPGAAGTRPCPRCRHCAVLVIRPVRRAPQ